MFGGMEESMGNVGGNILTGGRRRRRSGRSRKLSKKMCKKMCKTHRKKSGTRRRKSRRH